MASGGDEGLDVPAIKQKTIKTDRDKQRFLPNHHRMYRSPVRPFFCCGSQISLNSITEFKDGAVITEKDTDDDYEDVQTDSDDLLEEMDKLVLESAPKKHDRVSPRMGRTPLNGKRKKSSMRPEKSTARKKFWSLKLKGKLHVSKRSHYASTSEVCSPAQDTDICVCTSLKSKEEDARSLVEGGQEVSHANSLPVTAPQASTSDGARGSSTQDRNRLKAIKVKEIGFAFSNINNLYPINDIDEQLIAQRRHEMEHGIEVEDVWILKPSQSGSEPNKRGSVTSLVCSTDTKKSVGQYPSYGAMALLSSEAGNVDPADLISKQKRSSVDEEDLASSTLNLNASPWVPNIPQQQGQSRAGQFQVHTQVDYIHFLVPDLETIIHSSFYWGVMDRYQAEKLIENKPEGTFLLRDSAQDEFLFSVSFRRYGRSLHARIEQWNHKFSFDSRDPGVFATDTVCGLIDHYKDPSCCMFFEPMLTRPLNRTFPFSLQHLSRAAICSRITYDSISELTLPRSLKEYLQFYHYKQKVRVRRFDNVAKVTLVQGAWHS